MRKYILSTACPLITLVFLTFFSLYSVLPVSAATHAPAGHKSWRHACSAAPAGSAFCQALVAYDDSTNTAISPLANPTGGSAPYGPANFHSAYNLPTTASGTPTVAIVDAYNDPNAASDLATYRSHYGLPACTTGSGCLRIVNQTGGSSLPSNDSGWGLEISLDLDMVSAICENCHILLVEASSASFTNLGTAVNTAVSLGAVAVSNSYGGSSGSSYCNTYYNHTYVAITVSSGDSPGVEYPSACEYVTAVGGTTLNSSGSESAWSSAGGGCTSVARPSWQSSSVSGCSNRAAADVSADADPNTGANVYDTYGYSGWLQVGGTSESSPIIAGVYALAGNATTTQYPSALPWQRYGNGCLFTVGGTRYSYKGGLGSPNGVGCF
jgi:subtilase family serine protease